MLYHVPKPFYRKSRNTWYVQIDGRQVNLGRDREAAFIRYHQLMAMPAQDRRIAQENAGSGMRLAELFDLFLDRVLQHRSADTYAWYQYRLQRFANRFPDLTIGQLRPYWQRGLLHQFLRPQRRRPPRRDSGSRQLDGKPASQPAGK